MELIENDEARCVIYGHFDPFIVFTDKKEYVRNALAYVGATNQALKNRYKQHISAAKSETTRMCDIWFKSILDRGRQPIVKVLYSVEDKGLLHEIENKTIAEALLLGCRLVQKPNGGYRKYIENNKAPQYRPLNLPKISNIIEPINGYIDTWPFIQMVIEIFSDMAFDFSREIPHYPLNGSYGDWLEVIDPIKEIEKLCQYAPKGYYELQIKLIQTCLYYNPLRYKFYSLSSSKGHGGTVDEQELMNAKTTYQNAKLLVNEVENELLKLENNYKKLLPYVEFIKLVSSIKEKWPWNDNGTSGAYSTYESRSHAAAKGVKHIKFDELYFYKIKNSLAA